MTRARRAAFAAGAIAALVTGGALLRRARPQAHDEFDSAMLARRSATIQPSLATYVVAQNGVPVGTASTRISVTAREIIVSEAVRVRTIFYGDSMTIAAGGRAHLTRAFALDSLMYVVGGDQKPLTLRVTAPNLERVVPPTLIPAAVMLSGAARVGRVAHLWIYNPLSQHVEIAAFVIRADSLFTRGGVPTDTTRAWLITMPGGGIAAWADRDGNLLAASEPGGLTMTRTDFVAPR